MNVVLDKVPRGACVCIVRLRSLGDCVLTTPAIRILKNARPDLRIGVVVEPRFRDVFEGNPAVDRIMIPELPEVRRFRPELCINLHGGGRSARLTVLSGARWRAGFADFRFPFVYNVKIPTAQQILGVTRKVHTAEHVASAMFYLGVERCDIPRAQLFADSGRSGAYAVLHPVASEPEKAWPAKSFLQVARHLKEELRLEPMFVGGPGDDLSAFREFTVMQSAPLKPLLRDAALFVGNDSGPAHMAAAFGLPVVVIFGPSDPIVWAPWQTPSEVLTGSPISEVTPAQVTSALERLRVHA